MEILCTHRNEWLIYVCALWHGSKKNPRIFSSSMWPTLLNVVPSSKYTLGFLWHGRSYRVGRRLKSVTERMCRVYSPLSACSGGSKKNVPVSQRHIRCHLGSESASAGWTLLLSSAPQKLGVCSWESMRRKKQDSIVEGPVYSDHGKV